MLHQGRQMIKELEQRYIAESRISSLRIRFNALLGYFIEISPAQSAKTAAAAALANGAPSDIAATRIPKAFTLYQVLKTGTRYKSAELTELQDRVQSSGQEAIALEISLFRKLCDDHLLRDGVVQSVMACAHALAAVDVATASAALARLHHYTRPEVLPVADEGSDDHNTVYDLVIDHGRHPTVEQAQSRQSGAGR